MKIFAAKDHLHLRLVEELLKLMKGISNFHDFSFADRGKSGTRRRKKKKVCKRILMMASETGESDIFFYYSPCPC
jgi:hypothetical protein